MIKGHSKIELNNVKTGETKVYEDDNIVTNGASILMQPTSYYRCGFSYPVPFTDRIPYFDVLYGGILLFNNSITESVNNYFMPANNKMIGNAMSHYASAQNVPEFGAYNSEESTFNVSNGVATRKFVYDFGTSKANGTISSLCLTNLISGYAGFGNNSGLSERQNVDSLNFNDSSLFYKSFIRNSNLNLKNTGYYSINNIKDTNTNIVLLVNAEKNFIGLIDIYSLVYNASQASKHITSGTMTIKKGKINLTSFNCLTSSCVYEDSSNSNYFSRITLYDEVELSVPSVISSLDSSRCSYCQHYVDEDHVYLIFADTFNNNGNIYIWEIDADLSASRVYTTRNTTGYNISNGYYYSDGYSGKSVMAISNGYLICRTSSKMFKIKISDPTDVSELDTSFVTTKTGSFFTVDGVNVLYHDGYYTTFSINNDILRPINGRINNDLVGGSGYYYEIKHVTKSKNIVYNLEHNLGNSLWFYSTPYLLSTINNLASPVTKTSDMMMKISYTLTGDVE